MPVTVTVFELATLTSEKNELVSAIVTVSPKITPVKLPLTVAEVDLS